jgi:hypothetical protein
MNFINPTDLISLEKTKADLNKAMIAAFADKRSYLVILCSLIGTITRVLATTALNEKEIKEFFKDLGSKVCIDRALQEIRDIREHAEAADESDHK